MTTLEVLKAARERINDRAHWTKNAYVRDRNGHELLTLNSPYAARWCAVGALKLEQQAWPYEAIRLIEPLISPQNLYEFNDTHTHAEVLGAV